MLGILAAVVAATAYGSAYTVSRLVYDYGLNSLTLNSLRFLALFLIHVPLVWAARSTRVPIATLRYAWFVGLLIAISGVANLSSIAHIPVSMAILIFYTYPLVTLAISSILNRRAPSPAACVAFALTFFGLALTLEVSVDRLNAVGVGLALLASLAAGTHMVASQRGMQLADFRIITLHMALAATLITSLVTIGSGQVSLPTTENGMWLLAYVLCGYCLGIGSMLAAIRWMGPVQTSMVMCLEPPLVILCAYLILGEQFGGVQALGAVLVITGIALAQRATGMGVTAKPATS